MKRIWICLLLLSCLLVARPSLAQQRIKVMHYNLLRMGLPCNNVSISDKYDWLGTILDHYRPDIFTVNEIAPNNLVANGIRSISFDYTPKIANPPFTNQAQSEIVNQLFYNTNVIGYQGSEIIPNSLRDINVHHLYLKPAQGSSADTVYLTCIIGHFKASNTAQDANLRAMAAQSIMEWIDVNGQGKNLLVMGDFNIYNHQEAAFQTLVFNSNSNIALKDPSGKQNGWNGGPNAIWHTQSTRNTADGCGAGGGMDDRFDMVLASQGVMNNAAGLKYVDASYLAYGNDGSDYQQELGCNSNGPVPFGVCLALKQMSDHLPVVLELETDRPVGLEKDFLLDWQVFPNPFTGDLSIRWERPLAEPVLLSIFDAWGRQIHQEEVRAGQQSWTWSAEILAPGTYWLRLYQADGRQAMRALRKS